MSQNGIPGLKAGERSSGGGMRPRRTPSGITTVSSLESRLQDLGLSHVVGSASGGAAAASGGVGRNGSGPRPPAAPVAYRGLPPSTSGGDADTEAHPSSRSNAATDMSGKHVATDSQDSRAAPRGAQQGKPMRVELADPPNRAESEFDNLSRISAESPDSIMSDLDHHGRLEPQGSGVSLADSYTSGVQHQQHNRPRGSGGGAIFHAPRPKYQFCPNCGFQLVDNPIIEPIPRQILHAAIPAGDSDTDSEEERQSDQRVAARRGGPGQGPVSKVGQAELAAGKVRVASSAILKEMEGRRAQRLKNPGSEVVGQGKHARPLGAKGQIGGEHRRIGSVDHNIYSSAMPQKRGSQRGSALASAADALMEADEDACVIAEPQAGRRKGTPPLPSKAGTPPLPQKPKRPEVPRLQIAIDSTDTDGDSEDQVVDAKVIDVPDVPAGKAEQPSEKLTNKLRDVSVALEPQQLPPQQQQAVAVASVKAGMVKSGSTSTGKGGAYQTVLPSPGHRRISSWADGGNLKHTDFILRKPYRDVMDVYDVHDEELGVGQFGVIRSCVNRTTGALLACKTISKERIVCLEDADDVRKEVQLMQQLRGHPNIIDLHETFEDSKHVHLVMELCKGGELFDRIKMRGQYAERNAALVLQTLVEALLYCHSNGIVHRDIKPENILLMRKDDDTVIKVIDFGVAARFRHGEVLTEFVGTPYYMAPEVLSGNYGPEADIWSAGIVLYIMLCGFPPFWANSNEGIFDAIQNNELQFKSSKWRNVSEAGKDLIRLILVKDPRKRISALDLLGHPWIVSHSRAKASA